MCLYMNAEGYDYTLNLLENFIKKDEFQTFKIDITNKIDMAVEYLHSRENEVEGFLNEFSLDVKIMQEYIARELLDGKMHQDIVNKQMQTILVAPWYKKLFKSQRQKILDNIEKEIVQSYLPSFESINKRLTDFTNELMLVFNNDGKSGDKNVGEITNSKIL